MAYRRSLPRLFAIFCVASSAIVCVRAQDAATPVAAPAALGTPADAAAAGPLPATTMTNHEIVKELNKVNAKVDELRQQKEKLAEDLNTAQETYEKMILEEHQVARDTAVSKDQEITNLREEKRKAEETKAAELQEANNKVQEANNQLNAKTAELETSSKELQEARTKITSLMILQDDLMKQKNNLHMTYQELRQKYDNPELQHYVNTKAKEILSNSLVLQGAVNKTNELLLPALVTGTTTYSSLFENTHERIKSSIHPYLGDHSHFISGFVSYALFLIPLMCTIYCLVSIRAFFKIRGLILFADLYFATLTGVAAAFALYLRGDPSRFLQEANPGTYMWTQLVLGVSYLAYFLLHLLMLCNSKPSMHQSVKLSVVMVMGALYYAAIFVPALLDQPPRFTSDATFVNVLFYLIPAVAFSGMFYASRTHGALRGRGEKHTDDEMEILLSSTVSGAGDVDKNTVLRALNNVLPVLSGHGDVEAGKSA